MKSTWSGEVGFNAGSEGDSAGTVRRCEDDAEHLRDQNEAFRASMEEFPLVAEGEVEARFAVVNICVIETPRTRCCSSGEGCCGRNICVLLVFRRAFSALLFGKDVKATELV